MLSTPGYKWLPASLVLTLTSVWMASLDVSRDTDDGQGVDACKAKEQGEEAVYLEGDKKIIERSFFFYIFMFPLSLHGKGKVERKPSSRWEEANDCLNCPRPVFVDWH